MSLLVRHRKQAPIPRLSYHDQQRQRHLLLLQTRHQRRCTLRRHPSLLHGSLSPLLDSRLRRRFRRWDGRVDGFSSKVGSSSESGDLGVREVGERIDARHGGEEFSKDDEIFGRAGSELVRDVLEDGFVVDGEVVATTELSCEGGETWKGGKEKRRVEEKERR